MPSNKDFEVRNGLKVLTNGLMTANATARTIDVFGNVTCNSFSTANGITAGGTLDVAGNTTVTGQLFTYNASSIPVVALGTVASSGTAALNYASGSVFSVTHGGSITYNFTNLPSGYWEMAVTATNAGISSLAININGSPGSVTWVKGDGSSSTTFSTLGVSLQSVGVNHFVFWGVGNTIYGKAA